VSNFKIPLEDFSMVKMLEDRSVRIDIKYSSHGSDVHYPPLHQVVQPDQDGYHQLLEITGIKNPGDYYIPEGPNSATSGSA